MIVTPGPEIVCDGVFRDTGVAPETLRGAGTPDVSDRAVGDALDALEGG